MLLKAGGAERTAAGHLTVNLPASGKYEFDANADCSAVRLLTLKLNGDPVVAVSRVPEHCIPVGVSRDSTASVEKNVLVTVTVEVAESDPMAFLQVSGSRGRGHVRECLARFVAKEKIRHQGPVGGRAGAHVKIQVTVVVEVAEITAHGKNVPRHSQHAGNILKTALSHVAVTLKVSPFNGCPRYPRTTSARD